MIKYHKHSRLSMAKLTGEGYKPTYNGKLFKCYLCGGLKLEAEKEKIRGLEYCHYCAKMMDKPLRQATKIQLQKDEGEQI